MDIKILFNKNIKKITSIILILIGGCMSFIYIYNKYNIDVQDKNKIESFLKNNNYDSINKINDNTQNINNDFNNDTYSLILEIPKINLKKGIYNYSSKYNDVNKNIMLLKQSSMPNIQNSNIILASHSGNSRVSYFKDLDKLSIGDNIIIYYEGYKYIYTLNTHYRQEKTGTISINRNINVNTLTLITCDKTNKDYQLVYILYLDNIEKF